MSLMFPIVLLFDIPFLTQCPLQTHAHVYIHTQTPSIKSITLFFKKKPPKLIKNIGYKKYWLLPNYKVEKLKVNAIRMSFFLSFPRKHKKNNRTIFLQLVILALFFTFQIRTVWYFCDVALWVKKRVYRILHIQAFSSF